MLKNDVGEWIEDEKEIAQLFQSYFKKLFTEEHGEKGWIRTNQRLGEVTQEEVYGTNRGVDDEEIRRAFFQMGGYKAPGEDGFPAAFYQQNWKIVGKSVCRSIKEWWQNPDMIKEANKTLLVLIPKTEKPEKVSEFRPISLCNVLYKGLSKLIVNRLKGLMDKLVSPYQASFVPKRNIQDNIVVAKEVCHTMNKMQGRKGVMAIKIDLEKAYDRIEWQFFRNVLVETSMEPKFIDLLMACVTSASYDISNTKTFQP